MDDLEKAKSRIGDLRSFVLKRAWSGLQRRMNPIYSARVGKDHFIFTRSNESDLIMATCKEDHSMHDL